MKREVVFVVSMILTAAVLAGCGMSIKVETQAPETTAPVMATEPAQPEVYVIDGSCLYAQSAEGNRLVYDAAAYFPAGWDCSIGQFVAENDAVYLSEGGYPSGSDEYEDYHYDIVRIDNGGRTVLREDSVNGYTQIVSYGSRIIFVLDGFDSQDIGWANKDGSASDYLDFSGYAAQNGVMDYYNGATIYIKDGTLFADIAFFTDGDPEIVDHTVSISEDLEITRIN